MIYYDAELQRLQHEIARKRQLNAMLDDLYGQRRELTERVNALEAAKIKEQTDVDKLEGRSLAAFFYAVAGRKEEKLDKEREEAYAASVKYDAAAKELNAVQDAIRTKEAELGPIHDSEMRYYQVLREKKDAIKAAGGAEAEEILRLEEHIAYLNGQKKELEEARSAGLAALPVADELLSCLDNAYNNANCDLHLRNDLGLIATFAKYHHLNDAQEAAERLQVQLRLFKSELTDVSIQADMKVKIDDSLHFADYFFDSWFVDLKVRDQISRSKDHAQQTKRQIESVLGKLECMADDVETERNKAEDELEQLIREAGGI